MSDSRTRLTRAAIKDGMLELLNKTDFDSVTVASLCREAGVGRATFYTHYTGLMDVIDELADDAVNATERSPMGPYDASAFLANRMREYGGPAVLDKYMYLLPICQRVSDNPKYRCLFRDDRIAEYIIMRVFRTEKAEGIAELTGRYGISELQAEKIFFFGVMGAYHVNRSMGWKKDADWYEVQRALLTFIAGGTEALKKL